MCTIPVHKAILILDSNLARSVSDIYGYSLYSPDILHICFLDMFHVQGGIFPCVFLNLWSQEKISPYSKTTFLLLKFQGLRFLYFY